MVLIYENDPLDTEDAGGSFYHVCSGRIVKEAMTPPPPDQPYECPHCEIELETEDFFIAQMKGSV